MGPRRKLSSIKMIFGDGIFAGGSLLDTLNIRGTCRMGLDVYHLLQSDWPKHFGVHLWTRLADDFATMVYAANEEAFELSYGKIKDSLQKVQNGFYSTYLEDHVYKHRKYFVAFWVQSYPGTLITKTTPSINA
jgi:hypothetical protein